MADIGLVILALVIIVSFAAIFGFLVYYMNAGFKFKNCEYKGCCTKVTIPPLLGMLIGGFIAMNGINEIVGKMDPETSLYIRRFALTVILLRAGLGLNLNELKKKSTAVLRLTAMP
jgi:Kef-type K+ transport system membrane component KefB